MTVAFLALSNAFCWNCSSYSIKCYACQQLQKEHRGTCVGCPMWKDAWRNDGKYHYYKCSHGHKIRIPYGSDKNTRELSELEKFSVKEHSWVKIFK